MELVYHPSGEGVSRLEDGTEINYSDDSVVLYSAEVLHDQTPSRPGADVCIHLRLPPKAARMFPRADCFQQISDPWIRQEFWSLARDIPQTGSPISCILDLRVTALLLRLCMISKAGAAISNPQEALVQQARQFLQERFASVSCMSEVARHTGVSEDYLRHLFREREGISMMKYLARIRLERAKKLLRHSRLPLKAIASECGFGTDRYFCSRFQSQTGMSPITFRKQPAGPRPPDLPEAQTKEMPPVPRTVFTRDGNR